MPLYTYRCTACGYDNDLLQKYEMRHTAPDSCRHCLGQDLLYQGLECTAIHVHQPRGVITKQGQFVPCRMDDGTYDKKRQLTPHCLRKA